MATDTTIRLTMAQALVKYLQVQFSDRDGQRRRLIEGVFGIYGHGNVAGLGQALYEYGQDLPYYQPRNEQSMVHTAAAYAKNHPTDRDFRLHLLHRPGCDQHDHRGRDRDHKSTSRTAVALGLLRELDIKESSCRNSNIQFRRM